MEAELAIFILVGSISIISAVLMLTSENAVHSAIYLIANFSAVAFMYLMMNAPFLAMVQITVYTGAIMVLFLFVIMLMGAERILPQVGRQLHWMTPMTMAVVTVVLFIASIAILQSEIDESEPTPHDPMVRVIHTSSEVEPVDIYINGERFAFDLEFTETTEYKAWEAGEYTVDVFAHEADPATETPLVSDMIFLSEDDVTSLLVMPQSVDGSLLLRVDGSLESVEERNTSHLTVVHALPCSDPCPVDIADVTDPGNDPHLFTTSLNYGEIAPVEILRRDQYNSHTYTLAAYSAGEVQEALAVAEDEELNLEAIADLNEVEIEDNTSMLWVITGDTRTGFIRTRDILFQDDNRPSFGGPTGVGQLLFTKYLLPFQAIGMLLLVAMVGVLVLTKGSEPSRRSRYFPRRMAAVPGNPTIAEYMRSLATGETTPADTKQLPEQSSGE